MLKLILQGCCAGKGPYPSADQDRRGVSFGLLKSLCCTLYSKFCSQQHLLRYSEEDALTQEIFATLGPN